MSDLPLVDMRPPEFWEDPYGPLGVAREQHAIGVSPGGQRLVLRHREVLSVLQDPRMRSIGTGLLRNVGVTEGPLHEWWRLVMFNNDGAAHSRLRTLVSKAFTPRAIARMRPRIRELVRAAFAEACGRGHFDGVGEIAHLLPSRVTCEMLGVPTERHDAFAEWTAELGLVFSARLPPELRARCEHALLALSAEVDTLLEERRRRLTDDLLSGLLAAEAEGDRLSPEELTAMVLNLLFAGHDTTRSLLSFGLWRLLATPAALDAIRAEPALAAAATEEVLRFDPPVFGSLRTPSEDLEIAGVLCPAGEPVNVVFPAATRDPRVWDAPDAFDVRRFARERRGERPLAFGAGAHYCLGAALARAEAEEVFAHAATLPLRLEGPEPRVVPYAAIRRIDALPIAVGETA